MSLGDMCILIVLKMVIINEQYKVEKTYSPCETIFLAIAEVINRTAFFYLKSISFFEIWKLLISQVIIIRLG